MAAWICAQTENPGGWGCGGQTAGAELLTVASHMSTSAVNDPCDRRLLSHSCGLNFGVVRSDAAL